MIYNIAYYYIPTHPDIVPTYFMATDKHMHLNFIQTLMTMFACDEIATNENIEKKLCSDNQMYEQAAEHREIEKSALDMLREFIPEAIRQNQRQAFLDSFR